MISRDTDRERSVRRRARAVVLLQRILAARPLDIDALGEALVVNRATLHAYLSGTVSMPVERQLCLALFVIEHIPEFARQGHQLRAQIAAAIAFQEHATAIHNQAPAANGR
jgi:hypothetical protein